MHCEAEILKIPSEAGEGPVRVDFYASGGAGRRPLLLIFPGGGYEYRSEREALPIARALAPAGVHTAIVHYACYPALFPVSLLQTAEVMQYFRKEGAKHEVDSEEIFMIGFSAGGHLALSYALYCGREDFFKSYLKDPVTTQTEGLLLAYPVVTAGRYAHQGSIDHLLGPEGERRFPAEAVSLERQAAEAPSLPPLFLWHTFTDESVPVENSILLLNAYRKYHPELPCECHFYEKGVHGLALATAETDHGDGACIEPRAARWTEAAKDWLRARIDG